MASLPVPFTVNVSAVGGGGGGSSRSLGSRASSPGQDNKRDTGRGTPNPWQNTTSLARREHDSVRLDSTNYSPQTGHITIVRTTRIPKRFIFTAHASFWGDPPNTVGFTADVLLVPISFNAKTCFELYMERRPDFPGGLRRLRDNVILLRRLAAYGTRMAIAGEQTDVPEDLRDRTDYQLVFTCPRIYYDGPDDRFTLCLLLEMEF